MFQYILYDKLDTSIKNIEDYKTLEWNKTQNMINVCKCIKEIVLNHFNANKNSWQYSAIPAVAKQPF